VRIIPHYKFILPTGPAKIVVFTSHPLPCFLFIAAILNLLQPLKANSQGEPWKLHIINSSSAGADGTRLADVNGDGLQDIVTGWEEGGCVMLYLNPGPAKVKEPWPVVTVGRVNNVEDAVFVDLDEDGAVDVVSCCEGDTKSMFVHWAPLAADRYLDAVAWSTEVIPASQDKMQWMFCVPLQVDGINGIDLVAGGKNKNAKLGWFKAPENPRSLARWKWHPICELGWIMSIFAVDMDGDQDLDLLISDRKGDLRGCRWLENPGPGADQGTKWKNHFIGGLEHEVMFITLADPDNDQVLDVVAAVKPKSLLRWQRNSSEVPFRKSGEIVFPAGTGSAKAVELADIDLDGNLDFVVSCEQAGGVSGVFWLSQPTQMADKNWVFHDISGPRGTKYDLLQCIDLDQDGDLDVITSEEEENLGVIWYENPIK